MFNSFRRLISPSRNKPAVTVRLARPRLDSLEERDVPAVFIPGSIQGQDGWTGGTIAIPPQVDQAIAQPDANAYAGVGAWRVSNSTVNGGYNGNFQGWPFSPGLAVTAGQPSSGAGADRFTATFFFKSANAVADGSNIEVDLGSSAGNDRNSFLAITNRGDADGGLQLRVSEPDGATGDFKPTQIIATAISRTAYHRIDIVANFIDGDANDTFQVALDGVVLTNPLTGGTTFGTFEGFRNGSIPPGAYVLTNRLFFRSGGSPSVFTEGAPSSFGAFPDNAAQGFFFDNVSYSVSTQANPTVQLASYAASFEPTIEMVDVAVTKTDGVDTVSASQTLTYTLVVTNTGPNAAASVAFTDVFPTALTGVTWTSTAAGGATGNTLSGSGNINDSLDLPVGSTVTYTVTAKVAPVAPGTLSNTATATVPSGTTDLNPGNNSATDSDSIRTFIARNLAVSGSLDGAAQVYIPTAGQYATTPAASLSPFGALATNVRAATADIDGDTITDTILVTGPGVPLRVAVISGADNTTVLVAPFDPFQDPNFTGGGFVAAGDIDGDGKAEFVVTPDQGGGPRVSIFTRNPDATTTLLANFFGIDDPNFRGGARSALGDVNADGTLDLAVCAGFLGGPRTALFDGTTLLATPTRLVGDFFAFPGTDATTLRNGVFVAAGDIDGDGFAELIFGGGPGGAPRVFILSGALVSAGDVAGAQAAPVANFFVANNSTDRGGVRLSTKDADGDGRADVVAGSGEGSPAQARVYLGTNFTATGEPTVFQDLAVFGAQPLPSGVFVG